MQTPQRFRPSSPNMSDGDAILFFLRTLYGRPQMIAPTTNIQSSGLCLPTNSKNVVSTALHFPSDRRTLRHHVGAKDVRPAAGNLG